MKQTSKYAVLTKEFLESAIANRRSSFAIARLIGGNARTVRTYFRKHSVNAPMGYPRRVWNKGLTAQMDERVRKSCAACKAANTGRTPWNKGKKLPPLSLETRRKQSIALRGKYVGPLCSTWKGGTSPINKRLRMSGAFKEWRKNVFERDNYTCQECGLRGGVLHPHHIKAFAHFPELRFEVSNGQTLCETCHKATDSWGNRKAA